MNDNSCVLAEFEEFNLEGTIVIIYKTWYNGIKRVDLFDFNYTQR